MTVEELLILIRKLSVADQVRLLKQIEEGLKEKGVCEVDFDFALHGRESRRS